MADNLQKRPSKGILKNSSSFDRQDGHSHAKKAKETTFDEMNIIATLHPPDKDYGHMKIDEPKTPFNFSEDELDRLDATALAEKLKLAVDKPPKFQQQSSEDEDSEEEDSDLTEEEKLRRKEFRQKRKKHYNEFYAVQLARKLLEEDDEDDDDDDNSSSKASQSTSAKSSSKGRSPSPTSPKSNRRSSPVGNTNIQGSSKRT
ncbi:protein phosphatase inhibitor 2-like isoform X1 [Coccinella septempunctata]|uniref:protein phosphatase inhibitor 2-like isoform X1 n=2 Tax=Coccinella septempunctata TaxID=41139 RepID=UPI001D07C3CA|nr:protein phosphatase inhibitor 2-like isoform X1 [Coccinella septempunctata]